MQGIYSIKNLVTNQLYIGSAININNRFKIHKKELRKNIHTNNKLQNSWNKYGEESFIFTPEEIVENKKDLIKTEQEWLDVLWTSFNLYNICPTAGSCLGRRFSEESKEKMSKSHKGKPAPMLGKHHTDKTKETLAIAAKKQWDDVRQGKRLLEKKIVSSETREKQSLVKKGIKFSTEQKKNMSLAAKEAWRIRKEKGRAFCSEEKKKKISLAKKGRTLSEVTKNKMSLAQKIRRLSEKGNLNNEIL